MYSRNALWIYLQFLLLAYICMCQRMDNREWMYMGRPSLAEITPEWMDKTEGFLNQAFGKAANGARDTFCPCSECGNRKKKQGRSWGNIFASMDLRQTIPGGRSMVKPIVLEMRW